MAFQPIVDVNTGKVFAYEALVRGERGESAGSILGQVTKANRYAFDQSCRVKAISLAAQLGLADTNDGRQLELPGRIDSRFSLPVPRRCLVKMLPVWNERSGQQKEEAVERDKQAGTHRDGGDALPGQHMER
jgi:hypothetical protein